MGFADIAKKAKSAFEKRGGGEALKKDVGELKDIAKSEGSIADKAKKAAEAIKNPGAEGGAEAHRDATPRADATPPADAAPSSQG